MKAWFLASYNSAGLKGLMDKGGDSRKAAIEKLCSTMGVTLNDVAFTRGEYDIIASVDAPSEEVALGVLIAIQSNDIASKVCVLTELDIDPIVDHANNARPAYAPPGTTQFLVVVVH